MAYCSPARCVRIPSLFPESEMEAGQPRQQGGDDVKMGDLFGFQTPEPKVGAAARPNTADAEGGGAASESEQGGCPHRGDNEDGDDADAHNGGIHVLTCFAPGS